MPKLPAPDARRAPLLLRRNSKMARSPHAYVRGNTSQYYDWLHSLRGQRLPHGPAVWICGDCHIGNLGPLADTEGNIGLQLRDFDQTLIGNPAHDLVRLALSLATAARGAALPGVVTAHMLEQMMVGYDRALARADEDDVALPEKPPQIRMAMRAASKRSWKELADERFAGPDSRLPLGKDFWPLAPEERVALLSLFHTEDVLKLVTSLHAGDSDAPIELVDSAYWVKGCSSLGLLRYAVLLKVGPDYRLMDVKEAVRATAPRYPNVSMPRDNARRVLAGAQQLAPALGQRMAAGRLLERGVFVRELLPQDLKLEIDCMTTSEATTLAAYLAYVVGRAHARQMDPAARTRWRAELQRGSRKHLDTPAWLWDSVVALVASHEAGYLEHCRRYALPERDDDGMLVKPN